MTVIDTVLVDRAPGETRVVALAGTQVIDVFYHHPGQPTPGAVYAGQVEGSLPDGTAVFVNIGQDRAAIMPCAAAEYTQGQAIAVNVVQPPRGVKGAKVRLHTNADGPLAKAGAGKPGLVQAAPHPLAQCLTHAGKSVQRVIVTPNDADKTIASIIGPEAPIEKWAQSDDLFDHFGVDEAIEMALERTVSLPGGGRIHIESTAALTAVDVDAGPMAAADANKEALRTFAWQMRLRAIAGPIIVDLIPSRGRSKLVSLFKTLVADDPVPTQVSGLTPEGRLECNRRRLRPSLAEELLGPQPSIPRSSEATAYEMLRVAVRQAVKQKSSQLAVYSGPDVVGLLQSQLKPALDEAESVLKMKIDFRAREGKPRDWFEIEPKSS